VIPANVIKSELYGSVVAVKILKKEIGISDCLKVIINLSIDRAKGEPWTGIGKSEDIKEVLSRRQIGPAVLLERNLRKVVSREKARDISKEIIKIASVDFLKRNIPRFDKSKILSLGENERDSYLWDIQNKFFNADAEIKMEGEDSLLLTIRRCRFVELLGKIGEGDMAPLFCEGDKLFFDEYQKEIELDRPEKLSDGGNICDFRFRWVE